MYWNWRRRKWDEDHQYYFKIKNNCKKKRVPKFGTCIRRKCNEKKERKKSVYTSARHRGLHCRVEFSQRAGAGGRKYHRY